MNEFIRANLTKPSNEKLAKFLNLSESGVRKRINEQPELFAENLRDYRITVSPFIPISDYNIVKDTNYTIDNIIEGKIPGVINKDDTFLVPSVLDDMLITFEELKKFHECCVISLANFKGGVGKTSTAVNIATTLSFFGARVLIVDFDIQGNTTSMFDLYRDKLPAVKEKERQTKKIDIDLALSNKLEELYDFENSDFKYTIVDLLAAIQKENIKDMINESIINLNDKVNTIGRLDIIPNASNIENALKFEDIEKYLRNYGIQIKYLIVFFLM